MAFKVTDEHRRQFRNDGITKLLGAIDLGLVDELRSCFDWAVRHTGPTVFQVVSEGGDAFTLVDLDNRANRAMYEKAIARSPFGRIAADLWQSEFVGFLCEEVFWKKGNAAKTFWHQDTSYWQCGGEHWANFWIPLSAHGAEYALQVVRGSHKGVMYDGTTFNPKDPTEPLWGDAATFPRLPDISADLARDPKSWDIVSYDVEPGDVVVIHPRCLHAGGGSDHIPDTPSMYKYSPIKSANGARLSNGDPYRPEGVMNINHR